MNFEDLIDIVFTNLNLRKNRTFLTILGVIIGSTCIFTLMSLGQGLKKSFTESLESLGDARSISVYPGPKNSHAKVKDTIDDKSIKEIQNIEKVQDIIVKISVPIKNIYFKEKEFQCAIIGSNLNSSVLSNEILYGRYPGVNEKKAVIGYNLACSLLNLDPQDAKSNDKIKSLLNKTIELEYVLEDGVDFLKEYLPVEICGITKINSQFSSEINMSLSISKKIYKSVHISENKVKYSSISVICESIKDVSNIEKDILQLGYTAFSLNSVKESINKMLTLITMFLGFLGCISLLISSFGIANTMNMSILERRKEIGIIKVLGANISDVKKIFVCEALTIGFIGGIIGVFVGLIINSLGNYAMRIYEPTYTNVFIVTPFLIIFILLFSSLIGLLSGLYPATKASKLDVISVLKDE